MPPSEASAPVDGEEQPAILDFPVQLLARHAGLHGHGQVFGLQRDDAVHLRQVRADAAGHRQQVAFERGADAIGDQRHVVVMAQPRHRGYLVGAVREHHGIRQGGRERRFVAAMVLAHARRGGKALAEAGLQGLDDSGRQRRRASAAWGRVGSCRSPAGRSGARAAGSGPAGGRGAARFRLGVNLFILRPGPAARRRWPRRTACATRTAP